jgi:glycosyltransferase involved in cell wall biosynthesis
LIRACDVICLATRTPDPFPRAVLEAMAAGKPIVATQVGGILELVAHEESAILVPPADGAALAAGIERLLAAPETGVTLAARARARSRRFSIEHNVRRLEELYERLFDEHARSHAGQRGQRIAA